MDAPSLIIRPAAYADKAEICDRLAGTFTATSRAEWERLFEYEWLTEKPDFGLVAELDGRIVGCGGLLHSDREIAGVRRHFVSTLGWWVEPAHQGRLIGRRLVDALFERYPDATLTFLTTRPDHQRFWRRYPLQPFEDRRIVLHPGARGLAARGLRPVRIADVTPAAVGAAPFRILQDHLPLRCTPTVWSDGTDTCVIITRRRTTPLPRPAWLERLCGASPALAAWLQPRPAEGGVRRWVGWLRELAAFRWPLVEVMYVSDRAFARRHLPALTLRLARQHRAVGLLVEERRLGLAPTGRPYLPGHYYFASRHVGAEDVDALYSEIVLLPM